MGACKRGWHHDGGEAVVNYNHSGHVEVALSPVLKFLVPALFTIVMLEIATASLVENALALFTIVIIRRLAVVFCFASAILMWLVELGVLVMFLHRNYLCDVLKGVHD